MTYEVELKPLKHTVTGLERDFREVQEFNVHGAILFRTQRHVNEFPVEVIFSKKEITDSSTKYETSDDAIDAVKDDEIAKSLVIAALHKASKRSSDQIEEQLESGK